MRGSEREREKTNLVKWEIWRALFALTPPQHHHHILEWQWVEKKKLIERTNEWVGERDDDGKWDKVILNFICKCNREKLHRQTFVPLPLHLLHNDYDDDDDGYSDMHSNRVGDYGNFSRSMIFTRTTIIFFLKVWISISTPCQFIDTWIFLNFHLIKDKPWENFTK